MSVCEQMEASGIFGWPDVAMGGLGLALVGGWFGWWMRGRLHDAVMADVATYVRQLERKVKQ